MAIVKSESHSAPESYGALLGEIKERIRAAQYAALRAVNLELLSLYWDIGRLIATRQEGETWGRAVVENSREGSQGGISWRKRLFRS